MSGPGPKIINPWRFAEAGTSVQGEFPVARMTRFITMLQNSSGTGAYELTFALDGERLPVITGMISAVVEVICQRCLEPMALKVASEVRIGVVSSAEAASAAALDTVIVEDHKLSLAALVEDELILALPPSPVHSPGKCRPPAYPGAAESGGGMGPVRPFAELSKLKSGTVRRRS